MKTMILFAFTIFFGMSFTAYQGNAQSNKSSVKIEVIQFHSEHRCMTCLKIEQIARTTLANSFPNISFSLLNVEDSKNARWVEQFEATGTALFLYNPKTGKKKDLTNFAFMNAGEERIFEAELKKHIEEFMKG